MCSNVLRSNTGRYPDARITIISVRLEFENGHSTRTKLDRHWHTEKDLSILDVVALEEFDRNCILRNREEK